MSFGLIIRKLKKAAAKTEKTVKAAALLCVNICGKKLFGPVPAIMADALQQHHVHACALCLKCHMDHYEDALEKIYVKIN